MVCGWQTRRGLDEACWYRLVERGFDALPAVSGRVRRLGRRTATLRHAAARGTRSRNGRGAPSHGSPGAALGRRVTRLARHCPRRPRPASPERLAPSRPESVELGPVPAAAIAAGGARSRRQPLPPRQAGPRAVAAPARAAPRNARRGAQLGWIGPATGWLPARRGHWRRDRWRSSAIRNSRRCSGPDSRAEVPLTGMVGGVGGGRVGGSAGGAGGPRAGGRLQDQPPAAGADRGHAGAVSAPDGRIPRRAAAMSSPVARIVCALVWTQTAQVVILPDALLASHAPSHARDAA